MKKIVSKEPKAEKTMEEKKKEFSTYPVYIDTAKKTYILFGIIFLIGIIIFFLFFYQNAISKKDNLSSSTSIRN